MCQNISYPKVSVSEEGGMIYMITPCSELSITYQQNLAIGRDGSKLLLLTYIKYQVFFSQKIVFLFIIYLFMLIFNVYFLMLSLEIRKRIKQFSIATESSIKYPLLHRLKCSFRNINDYKILPTLYFTRGKLLLLYEYMGKADRKINIFCYF